jgi:protoheme IX farnesyltransferase
LLCYIVAYLIAVTALTVLGYAGWAYLVIALGFGLAWAWRALRGWKTPDDVRWAKGVFLYSLIVLVTFSIALALSPVLP